jgi:hypothetical protein
MDVSAYRERYLAELEQAEQRRPRFRDRMAAAAPPVGQAAGRAGAEPFGVGDADDLNAASTVMDDRDRDVPLRAEAIQVVGAAVGERPELLDRLIEMLRDPSEPTALRLAALAVLQQSSFQSAMFAPRRPEYMAALRSVVDDRDPTLRRRALGILARARDEYAQRRLLEGLERPSRALVSAAKAIQMLGYDVHAEYFPLLRRIVEHPPTATARREAVRLLGADPAAKELLTGIFRDKREGREIRNISGLALQSLDPERFEALAREVVLDDDDDDQLRSTCLTALAHFASPAVVGQDGELTRRVEQIGRRSTSPALRQASRSYMAKYGG